MVSLTNMLKIATIWQEVCIWFRKFCTDLWSQKYHKTHHSWCHLILWSTDSSTAPVPVKRLIDSLLNPLLLSFHPHKMLWIETGYIPECNESWTIRPCKSPSPGGYVVGSFYENQMVIVFGTLAGSGQDPSLVANRIISGNSISVFLKDKGILFVATLRVVYRRVWCF